VPRGGKRAGAGRKPVTDSFGRVMIGAECEKRFGSIWQEARDRVWCERAAEVRAAQQEFKDVPVADRAAFRNSQRGHELAEEVEQAIRAVRNTPDWVEQTNRVFSPSAPRPKGHKARICQEVAAEYSARWHVHLTTRFVRECWDFYRRFERETRPPGV
jgi:hypothetical protein